jgi:membrane protease YdiL (CAAX protease family)
MGDTFSCSLCGKPIEPVNWRPGKLAQCKACGCDNIIPKEPESKTEDSFDFSQDDFGSTTETYDAIIETRSATFMDLVKGVAVIWSLEALARFLLKTLVKREIIDKITGIMCFDALDHFLVILIAWYFLCFKHKKSILEGLYIRRIKILTVFISVFLGFFMVFTCGFLRQFCSTSVTMSDAPIRHFLSNPKNFSFYIIGAIYFAPIFEEIYYRGFIFSILRNKIGAVSGIIVTGLWFGLIHGRQLGWDITGVANIVLGGLVLTTLRHKTDSIIPPIITHLTYNVTMFFMGFLAPFI